MKIYLTPTAKIIALQTKDVITTSTNPTNDNFIEYPSTWPQEFTNGGTMS